ncbi:hypothetical protein [Mesorhizobium australicum]|uniref:hypothetical protein n=1 Tax=Mesorhizobium australicum TaxID=536018 RepID=UPI00333D343E
MALKKCGAERVLKITNTPAQGRMVDSKASRGAKETTFLRDDDRAIKRNQLDASPHRVSFINGGVTRIDYFPIRFRRNIAQAAPGGHELGLPLAL